MALATREFTNVGISKYLEQNLVLFLDVQTQTEALSLLVQKLGANQKLKDQEAFYRAIWDREKIVSTGIGLGVAVPHAKLPGYKNFFVAIGIQKGNGIEWNSLDGLNVHLIFMIGGPDNEQTEYLGILSSLTVAIKDPHRRKALLETTEARQVIDLFKGC